MSRSRLVLMACSFAGAAIGLSMPAGAHAATGEEVRVAMANYAAANAEHDAASRATKKREAFAKRRKEYAGDVRNDCTECESCAGCDRCSNCADCADCGSLAITPANL